MLRLKNSEKKIPIILCGNKCDLISERKIPKLEGENLSKNWGCLFFETSAIRRINVEEIFNNLVRKIKNQEINPQNCKKKSQGTCTLL